MHPKVAELLERPQWVQRTPEWYERRKTLMTASDAAGALGIPAFGPAANPEMVRANLIKQKCHSTFRGNMFTQHGCDHEDAVRDRLAEIWSDEALEFGLLVHPQLPWLGASPDGIFATSGYMIEIKCPYKRQIVPGHIPHHYYPQVQVQMEVCDLPGTLFVQWMPAHLTDDGHEIFDVVCIERDRHWFAQNKDTLHDFWKSLMQAREAWVPPPAPTTRIQEDLYDL